jgi:hypothetical protein
LPNARATAAVNSLTLLDLVELAPIGLAPKSQHQVYLAESDHAPFGRLVPLAVFTTNPDGGAIVQTIGPLKTFAASGSDAAGVPSRRFLIVAELKGRSQVVLRQAGASAGPVNGKQ